MADQDHLAVQFKMLVEGVREYAIYMMDPLGRILTWNTGAQNIKGYNADEIIGQHFSTFYTETDREQGIPEIALQQAAATGKFESEGWRRRKDGSVFWASAVVSPIYDASGQLVAFAKVTRDITEKHDAQRMLDQVREHMLQSQKMEAIGQLTGGVAHDFNNLLTVVIGELKIALDKIAAPDPPIGRVQRAISAALNGANRAAVLTQRLLAFARQQPLRPKPLNLNKFIAGEVEFLQRSLGETIEVLAVGGAGLWRLEVDEGQLEATLLNLAVNARDAIGDIPNGKLSIETSNAFLDENYCRANPEVSPGQYVLISVTDNGKGMSKNVVDRAFEPFFTTKPAGRGTGLGLSQVYGFIKQSGGHIKVYSEVGQGTTVKMYLPRLAGGPADDEPDSLARPATGESEETILIVEDDGDVRAFLVEALRDLNYKVLAAADAVGGLDFVRQPKVRIDLLLTDVVLPGMGGRDFAREANKLRPGLKVLYMTGYSRNAIVHQGRLDAGVELIQKPVTQDQLAERVRALLDRK